MAPHSSTFAWKIPWTEEPGRLQSLGSLESDTTERLHFHFSLPCIGEGNGNPLQCSCLKNPRDGGAWWAAVYGVAQGRTRLKRLSSSSTFPVVVLSLCDSMDCSTPGFPVLHHLPKLAQTHACPLNRWCHPTISSSVLPFCLWSFPVSVSFLLGA